MTHGAISWIEMPVKDLERDPRFYEEVFGWKIVRDERFPNYVMFQDPTDVMGGGMSREITPAAEGGPHIHITVDSIDATLEAIEARGGKRFHERSLISEDVGWWAGFVDPAGNRMFLYESSRLPAQG